MNRYFLTVALAFLALPAAAEMRVDGLLTINPEWHEAIAAGQCLTEAGFGECVAQRAEDFGPASNGHYYQGATVASDSLLFTKFNIYSEECRGAATAADRDGWCDKRDAVIAELDALGYCPDDSGFRLCPAAMGD